MCTRLRSRPLPGTNVWQLASGTSSVEPSPSCTPERQVGPADLLVGADVVARSHPVVPACCRAGEPHWVGRVGSTSWGPRAGSAGGAGFGGHAVNAGRIRSACDSRPLFPPLQGAHRLRGLCSASHGHRAGGEQVAWSHGLQQQEPWCQQRAMRAGRAAAILLLAPLCAGHHCGGQEGRRLPARRQCAAQVHHAEAEHGPGAGVCMQQSIALTRHAACRTRQHRTHP